MSDGANTCRTREASDETQRSKERSGKKKKDEEVEMQKKQGEARAAEIREKATTRKRRRQYMCGREV